MNAIKRRRAFILHRAFLWFVPLTCS